MERRNQKSTDPPKRRLTTVYDAVAGRLGPNGFLTSEQLNSTTTKPLRSEEAILQNKNAPETVPDGFYNADERLTSNQRLPGSDLIKAVHAYASDFYDMGTTDKGQHDFKSFDETALLAMGILLEEAAREVLGETGDMALVEPEGLDHGLPESKMVKHQINGRVTPAPVQAKVQYDSEGSSDEDMRSKKRKMTRQ